MKTKLQLFLLSFGLSALLAGCKPTSIQTTQHIQNGDRLANENKFEQARLEYLQYLKLGAQLGIFRNELLEAETHRKIAYAYSADAKYDSSIVHLGLALKKDQKFPDNLTSIISDVTEMALVKAYKGNYLDALKDIDFYIDSLKISVRKNADRQAYANLLLAKGRINFSLGEFQRCEQTLLACWALIELYPFEVEKAEVKYLLGVLYKDQGRLTRSATEIEAAIAILKRAGLNYSLQLHAQGDQLFLQGLLEAGIAKHIEGLRQAESSNIIPLVIRSHTNLGEAYEFIGNRKQADFHYLKAIELQRKLIEMGYIEHPLPKKADMGTLMSYYQQTGQKSGIAKASVGMADHYKTLGQLDSSLFYLNQAYQFYSQSRQYVQGRNIELKLISVLLEMGDLDSAGSMLRGFNEEQETRSFELPYLKGKYAYLRGNKDTAKNYLRQAVTIIEDNRSGFSIPSLRSNYLGTTNYVYEELIEVLLNSDSTSYQEILEAYDWNERARSRSFLDIIAAKKINPLSPEHTIVLDQEQSTRLKLIRLNEEIEKGLLSADLLNEFKHTKELHNTQINNIISINPQYGLLLTSNVSSLKEIQQVLCSDELLIEYWVGTERAYLWYATKDTLGLVKLNFKEAELERELSAFRNAIKFELKAEARTLSNKLFSRLLAALPDLSSYSTLVLIPHRSQNFIPFEAIQYPKGNYLIEVHSLAYAPSGTIFLAKRKSQLESSGKMLAMALGEETFGKYTPLPGTALEVQNIAKYFNPTQVKIGLSSTESTLKTSQTDFGLIHLATHGMMNKSNPLQSFIVLNSDSINDGRLTVSEIFDMRLNASLTTLSACETALGEVNRGNELIGLSTAFLYCCSKAVIVSLWKVDDKATSLLMTSFYEHLSKGLTVSNSMAMAQRKLMAIPEYASNPYYWSPFIIIGDGQLTTVN